MSEFYSRLANQTRLNREISHALVLFLKHRLEIYSLTIYHPSNRDMDMDITLSRFVKNHFVAREIECIGINLPVQIHKFDSLIARSYINYNFGPGSCYAIPSRNLMRVNLQADMRQTKIISSSVYSKFAPVI